MQYGVGRSVGYFLHSWAVGVWRASGISKIIPTSRFFYIYISKHSSNYGEGRPVNKKELKFQKKI